METCEKKILLFFRSYIVRGLVATVFVWHLVHKCVFKVRTDIWKLFFSCFQNSLKAPSDGLRGGSFCEQFLFELDEIPQSRDLSLLETEICDNTRCPAVFGLKVRIYTGPDYFLVYLSVVFIGITEICMRKHSEYVQVAFSCCVYCVSVFFEHLTFAEAIITLLGPGCDKFPMLNQGRSVYV